MPRVVASLPRWREDGREKHGWAAVFASIMCSCPDLKHLANVPSYCRAIPKRFLRWAEFGTVVPGLGGVPMVKEYP
jgi:hypothetical protein